MVGNKSVVRVWWEVGVKTAVVDGGVSGAFWGFPAVVAVTPLLEFSGSSPVLFCSPA